jgi:hypothetical protein
LDLTRLQIDAGFAQTSRPVGTGIGLVDDERRERGEHGRARWPPAGPDERLAEQDLPVATLSLRVNPTRARLLAFPPDAHTPVVDHWAQLTEGQRRGPIR